METLDEYSPVGDQVGKRESDIEILRVLEELKISYPNEIVAQTGISLQTVLSRLGYLRTQKIIERVILELRPSEELKARLPSLWAQGLKGGTIKRMSWYRVVKHEAGKKK